LRTVIRFSCELLSSGDSAGRGDRRDSLSPFAPPPSRHHFRTGETPVPLWGIESVPQRFRLAGIYDEARGILDLSINRPQRPCGVGDYIFVPIFVFIFVGRTTRIVTRIATRILILFHLCLDLCLYLCREIAKDRDKDQDKDIDFSPSLSRSLSLSLSGDRQGL